MATTPENYFIHIYNTEFLNNSKNLTIQKRNQLFQTINGDAFYYLDNWPTECVQIFWKKPISDQETFRLVLFFCGNGGAPDLIGRWILTSQFWTTIDKQIKRARQLDFICKNLIDKNNVWFYFDMYFNDWRYLNRIKRTIN